MKEDNFKITISKVITDNDSGYRNKGIKQQKLVIWDSQPTKNRRIHLIGRTMNPVNANKTINNTRYLIKCSWNIYG